MRTKLSTVKTIIHSIIPQVKVVLKDGTSSAIHYSIETNFFGEIIRVDAIDKFTISNVSCKDKIISTITPEWISTAKKYHDILFSILHEIGHYYTIVGTNFTEHSQAMEKIKSTYYDSHRANVVYHQLPVEKRADAWAIDWLEKHPKTASIFSKMLEQVY